VANRLAISQPTLNGLEHARQNTGSKPWSGFARRSAVRSATYVTLARDYAYDRRRLITEE
jgi:hypothetical protein